MAYFCNPVNAVYRYQFTRDRIKGNRAINREAADPSVILFKGKYYLFASMTLGVWVSDDLANWEVYRLPDNLPLYDYAPDVCVVGDWVYLSASDAYSDRSFYRTKDILNGPYEEIKTKMRFHDPHLFADDDGRLYFYWGCSTDPIQGVELNRDTMEPITEPISLIPADPYTKGYERIGEDNAYLPMEELEVISLLKDKGIDVEHAESSFIRMLQGIFGRHPFIEGAWMTKYEGKYYLQYAFAGTEYNIYGDGVYVSNNPLGPYKMAKNNPYSFQPGGFLPGAGHGSTFQDRYGNWWHAGTMRISVNHNFERRVGIWPAGFDMDGELFCNTRYGDWPRKAPAGKRNPWQDPEWFLLSYQKNTSASSGNARNAVDENVQTWWQAESNNPGEWIQVDLDAPCDVRAIQVNFADGKIQMEHTVAFEGERYIEEKELRTRYLLEGSLDGVTYITLSDRMNTVEDRAHETHFVKERVRYVRVTVQGVPYHQKPCISGLRVFGRGDGMQPDAPVFVAEINGTDMDIQISGNAVGYNILWGYAPDKLYHSCMVYGDRKHIGALIKDQSCYVRVDAFNENGITEGTVKQVV